MSTGTSSYGRSASFRKIGDLLTVGCRPVVKGDQLRYYSSLLNSVFDLGETLAKPLVGLATRIATKIAAYTYAFLVNRLLGRSQRRIKYLGA